MITGTTNMSKKYTENLEKIQQSCSRSRKAERDRFFFSLFFRLFSGLVTNFTASRTGSTARVVTCCHRLFIPHSQLTAIKRFRFERTKLESVSTSLFSKHITMAKLDEYLWIAVLGGILGFCYGFLIGANDVANAFASSISSKSITLKQAVSKSI